MKCRTQSYQCKVNLWGHPVKGASCLFDLFYNLEETKCPHIKTKRSRKRNGEKILADRCASLEALRSNEAIGAPAEKLFRLVRSLTRTRESAFSNLRDRF